LACMTFAKVAPSVWNGPLECCALHHFINCTRAPWHSGFALQTHTTPRCSVALPFLVHAHHPHISGSGNVGMLAAQYCLDLCLSLKGKTKVHTAFGCSMSYSAGKGHTDKSSERQPQACKLLNPNIWGAYFDRQPSQ